jgi:effector-binding domain-containing protein
VTFLPGQPLASAGCFTLAERTLAGVREHVVNVVTVPPRATAVVAQTTTWELFPQLWRRLLDEVYAFVRSRPDLAGTTGPGPKWQNVMLYKDDRPAVEVGVLVGAPFSRQGRVTPSHLPGGRAAMTVHRGDYTGLRGAHDAVHRFAHESGLELAGPRWEIYGHATPDPRDLETEIFYLLG